MIYFYIVFFAIQLCLFSYNIETGRLDLIPVNLFGIVVCVLGIIYTSKKGNGNGSE